jgi:hypothetical protein
MIPHWNAAGVIPPIMPGAPGHSPERSPYIVDISEVRAQFATTTERIKIIKGLLNYRKALYNVGIVSGFQWLDGSFMEDIETIELRPPKDLDVVTFFNLPSGHTQKSLSSIAGELFDNQYTKATFSIDSYFKVLGEKIEPRHVREISYWYSMWSHRRDRIWKGFVQVGLNPVIDKDEMLILETFNPGDL